MNNTYKMDLQDEQALRYEIEQEVLAEIAEIDREVERNTLLVIGAGVVIAASLVYIVFSI